MGHSSYLGFTQGLLSKIVECNTAVEEWVEREKKAANTMEQQYRQTLRKEQLAIDALEEDLLSVKFQLGVDITNKDNENSPGIAQKQQQLTQQTQQLQETIETLKTDRDNKEERVKKLQEEAQREEARAAEVRSRKLAAELSKNTTVDDLTRGIVNYKYLGLDFEKAQNNKLRFTFTQIDPHNPLQKFGFLLEANDYDAYDVEDCTPPISQDTLMELLHDLNSDDDLGQFVMRMRMAFVETLSK